MTGYIMSGESFVNVFVSTSFKKERVFKKVQAVYTTANE